MDDQHNEATGERRERSLLRWIAETAVTVALAFLIANVIRLFVIQPFVIPSGSMEPTIVPGDRVFVNRFIFRFREPDRGDIVVFNAWRPGQPDLIKRVVGLPGERIAMDDSGRFTIDGSPIEEPYLTPESRLTKAGPLLPYTIPPRHIWVMGDNRNNSGDSRFNGPVPYSRLVGDAFAIYWPPDRIGGL
ncbi:MAG: signal peptidase I [Actinobacteria bacterium]|nr:MAG: signal peptidase I [Actinomycetota bacterium]